MEEFDEPPPRERKSYPTPVSKMSKVPSWISLGFVLGAAFVLAWPKPKQAAPQVKLVEAVRAAPEETKLTTIEAVFAAWGQFAVWDGDTTEIAYWNPGTKEFSEFYEVRRVGGENYFRSIGRLTRRIINRGKPLPAECPLQFTETEEQYREWLEHGRTERATRPAPPPPAAVPIPPADAPASRK